MLIFDGFPSIFIPLTFLSSKNINLYIIFLNLVYCIFNSMVCVTEMLERNLSKSMVVFFVVSKAFEWLKFFRFLFLVIKKLLTQTEKCCFNHLSGQFK